MAQKTGKQTVMFDKTVGVQAAASVVGKKEGEGPLGNRFDVTEQDPLLGSDSWEQAEGAFVRAAAQLALKKAGVAAADLDYILAGDLLDQSISSTFGLIGFERPYLGIFGACSTFGEGLGLAAMLIDGGGAKNAAVCAASHFCAAEKQFRFPLELGAQRPPGASWTVTGAGATVLSDHGGVCVTHFTAGRIVDMGVKDANNMGAAMAPAAADTLIAHFADTNRKPKDYDAIVTGDLGHIGHGLVIELLNKAGYDMGANYADCGIDIFDQKNQDTHNGGSGCACSAVVFAAKYYNDMRRGLIKKMLLVPTGALLSPTSSRQGLTIPGIAHAVAIEVV